MRKKILVVDDERDLVELIKIRLKIKGYDVEGAYDGDEGLDKAASYKPNLIFLDIMMPHKSGLEVLKDLKRSDSSLRNIPVIMLSALKDTTNIIKAQKLGATDYLMKPYSAEDLLGLIKKYVL